MSDENDFFNHSDHYFSDSMLDMPSLPGVAAFSEGVPRVRNALPCRSAQLQRGTMELPACTENVL